MKYPSNRMGVVAVNKRRGCARLAKGSSGFTLVEVLVVIAIMAVLTAIAIPSFVQWRKSIRAKEVIWDIVGKGRLGRQLAVNRNLEYRLEFDIDGRRYRLVQGDAPFGSTVWVEARPWEDLSQFVNWSTGSACDGTADINFEFNPNGTAEATVDTICINDTEGNLRFKAVISLTVAMVRIE